MDKLNMEKRLENIYDILTDILNETQKEQILISRDALEKILHEANLEPIN